MWNQPQVTKMGEKPKLNISSNIRRNHSPFFSLAFTQTINTAEQSEYHLPIVQCTVYTYSRRWHFTTVRAFFLIFFCLFHFFFRFLPYMCITSQLIFNSNDFHLVVAWKHLKSVNEIMYENTNKNAKTIFLPCIKLAPQRKTISFVNYVRRHRCHVQMKFSLALCRSSTISMLSQRFGNEFYTKVDWYTSKNIWIFIGIYYIWNKHWRTHNEREHGPWAMAQSQCTFSNVLLWIYFYFICFFFSFSSSLCFFFCLSFLYLFDRNNGCLTLLLPIDWCHFRM